MGAIGGRSDRRRLAHRPAAPRPLADRPRRPPVPGRLRPVRPHRPVPRAGRPLGLDGQRVDAFARSVAGRRPERLTGGPAVLNLFAYTGGASIALAAAGARVTHVDASRPAIGWARENAALNGVSTIRWIHEDARRFVDRERRRGRQYDALLLDPPAFGRGPAGDWQLDRDLAGLLESAIALLRPDPAFVLLNVYTGARRGDLDGCWRGPWTPGPTPAARSDRGDTLSLTRGRPLGADSPAETLSLPSADGRPRCRRGDLRPRRAGSGAARSRESAAADLGRDAQQAAGELELDEPGRLRRRHHVAPRRRQHQLDQPLGGRSSRRRRRSRRPPRPGPRGRRLPRPGRRQSAGAPAAARRPRRRRRGARRRPPGR